MRSPSSWTRRGERTGPRHALLGPARLPLPAGAARGAEARCGGGIAAPGNDRTLRPRPAPGRPGAAVRASDGTFHAGAGQSFRHGAPHLPGDGRRGHRCAARTWQASLRAARTGAAEGHARSVGTAPGIERHGFEGIRHGSEGTLVGSMPGGGVGGQGRESRPAAGADLLAGGRGPLDYLGTDGDAGAAQGTGRTSASTASR